MKQTTQGAPNNPQTTTENMITTLHICSLHFPYYYYGILKQKHRCLFHFTPWYSNRNLQQRQKFSLCQFSYANIKVLQPPKLIIWFWSSKILSFFFLKVLSAS